MAAEPWVAIGGLPDYGSDAETIPTCLDDLRQEEFFHDPNAPDDEMQGRTDGSPPKRRTNLVYVHEILKDEHGFIRDIRAYSLFYNWSEQERGALFLIFGEEILFKVPNTVDGRGPSFSFSNFHQPERISFVLRPTGSYLIKNGVSGVCPQRCMTGQLWDKDVLLEFPEFSDAKDVKSYGPWCPVCLGKSVVRWQLVLRQMLEAQRFIDMDLPRESQVAVNEARVRVGYSPESLCEAEWDYYWSDDNIQNAKCPSNGNTLIEIPYLPIISEQALPISSTFMRKKIYAQHHDLEGRLYALKLDLSATIIENCQLRP